MSDMELHDFAECLSVDDTLHVRQGDVFEWLIDPRMSADPWRRWGIVVTADCDIAQGKHGDVVSYVPLLTIEDYLRMFVLPSSLEKSLHSRKEQLFSQIRNVQASHRADFPTPLSDDVIEDWLSDADPDQILTELDMPTGKQRDGVKKLMSEVIACINALKHGGLDQLVGALVKLRGGKAEHAKNVKVQLSDSVRALPGDAFFVGRLAGIERRGFVAYLRLVRELHSSEVAIKQSDLRNGQVKARRIGRLAAPYVYRLTQQLGDVFSSIGLPSSYEKNREATVGALWAAIEAAVYSFARNEQ